VVGDEEEERKMSVGGEVVQVLTRAKTSCIVEVLDTQNFDRSWRLLELPAGDIHIGDLLWWQDFTGYLSRMGDFVDRDIGSCRPAQYRVTIVDP